MYLLLFIFICSFSFLTANKTEEDRSGDPLPDYGFVAYLFSTLNTSVRCTGAIVSDSYILNYCEYGLYKYNAVRVGISKHVPQSRTKEFIYELEERVRFPTQHSTPFPQVNEEYDLDLLYSSRDSIFLDRTKRPMTLNVNDAVWPIVLSRTSNLPSNAYAHFFSRENTQKGETNARYRELLIANNSDCDDYYGRTYNLALGRKQFCVNSSMVSFDDCCANHAIMESDKRLIGIMAWSTACWNPPEPWVFTNLGYYYDWITDIISGDPIFPPTRTMKGKRSKS